MKNADVSRTQGMCHMIYAFLRSSLGKYNCAKCHHCGICVADFKEGGQYDMFTPIISCPVFTPQKLDQYCKITDNVPFFPGDS